MAKAVRVSIYVQPRAASSAVVGMHDGFIRIRLAAPPVDGAANRTLLMFLAQRLGVSKSRVRISAGLSGRRKIVEIEGVSEQAVQAALQAGKLICRPLRTGSRGTAQHRRALLIGRMPRWRARS